MKTFNVLLLIGSFIVGFGIIYIGDPITQGQAFGILLSCGIFVTAVTFLNTNKMVEHKDAPNLKDTYESISNGNSKTAIDELLA